MGLDERVAIKPNGASIERRTEPFLIDEFPVFINDSW
jgi:hypothetical protein